MVRIVGILILISVVVFLIYIIFFKKKNIKIKEDIKINTKVKDNKKDINKFDNYIQEIINLEINLSAHNIYLKNREELFDKIYLLIKLLKERNYDIDSSMFFELKKLLKETLPERLRTYQLLSFENRKKREKEFLNDIKKIEEVIDNYLKILEREDISNDERESLLISIKY